MADSWNEATKQAMKILGSKGKIPDIKPLFKYNADVIAKTWATFEKMRDDLDAKIAEIEGQYEKLSGMYDQFEAKVEKDNLGLNEKDKEELKQIDQARDILTDVLHTSEKICDDNIKTLKEVARHLILLSKYKPDSVSG